METEHARVVHLCPESTAELVGIKRLSEEDSRQ
jgi:hypothetical protein